MSKGIDFLNKEQIEALNNDCTMLWMMPKHRMAKEVVDLHLANNKENQLISIFSLLQIGQEYYVQEEFHSSDLYYTGEPSQMQEHQSRFKFRVTDIQVKRVQEIIVADYFKMGFTDHGTGGSIYFNSTKQESVEDWHNEQYPNQPYKDNLYGFLVTIERID